jgi:hypothetical protein
MMAAMAVSANLDDHEVAEIRARVRAAHEAGGPDEEGEAECLG